MNENHDLIVAKVQQVLVHLFQAINSANLTTLKQLSSGEMLDDLSRESDEFISKDLENNYLHRGSAQIIDFQSTQIIGDTGIMELPELAFVDCLVSYEKINLLTQVNAQLLLDKYQWKVFHLEAEIINSADNAS